MGSALALDLAESRARRASLKPWLCLCSVTAWPAAARCLSAGRRRARAGERTSSEPGAGSPLRAAARTRTHKL